jgi:teichuronic acid exporter
VVLPSLALRGDQQISGAVNRGIAWAGAAQTLVSIADVVSAVVVLGWWLSPRDYGLSSLAFVYFPLLDMAADLGVAAALIQRDDHTPDRVSTVFWFNVLVSLFLFGSLAVLGPVVGALQGAPVVGALLTAYGAKLVFQNVYAIPLALMRKQLRFGEIAVIRTSAHLTESVARIVLAALGVTIWCFTLAALLRVVLFGVAVWARNPFLPRLVFRPREVADYFKFGLRSSGSQLLYQLYVNADVHVVAYFFGAAASGIYKVVVHDLVLSPVRIITNVVADVAFPAFARLRFEGARLVEQLESFTRINLIAVLPLVAFIYLAAPELIALLFPPAYLAGVPWARLLCLIATLRALGFLGPPLLDGIGRAELTLRYTTVAALAVLTSFIAFAIFTGERLGPLSVALAWAAAYPIAFLVLAVLVAQAVHLPVRRFLGRISGIVACVAGGLLAGTLARLGTEAVAAPLRLGTIAAATLVPTLLLLVFWQGVTPRRISQALRGS